MNKKQITLAAMMMVAATNFSFAQSFFPSLGKFTPAQKERIERIYAASLDSWNKGIIESALAVATMIKLDLPLDELPLLREKIENLATFSKIPSIRYKACLALDVFIDPVKYKQEDLRRYKDTDEFFSALNEETNQPVLSVK